MTYGDFVSKAESEGVDTSDSVLMWKSFILYSVALQERQRIATDKAKDNDYSIHVGQQLHKIYRCYTAELGQTVHVTNGTVEEISVFNGECKISIRWDYGACQCVGLDYINTKVFLDRESANIKLFEAVENG